MTRVSQFIAHYVRAFAQWLDPLPDAVSALHDAIELLRDDLDAAQRALRSEQDDHRVDVETRRTELQAAEDALVALQRKHAACLPVPQDELYAAAVRVTQELDASDATGQWKRGQAYARLKDAYPSRSGMERSLAIEAALWR